MDFIKIRKYISDNKESFIISCLLVLSFFAFFVYYNSGVHVAYGDAVSRLNIARKVLDNLTPGLGQLGSVWLPFPQILMIPFVSSGFLWHSGIAGSIVSMVSYLIGGFFVYKLSQLLTKSTFGSILALLVYSLNINLLYFQTTAMSEPIFIMFLCMIMYFSVSWVQTNKVTTLMCLALSVTGITLTRYEGLAILFTCIAFVGAYSLFATKKWSKTEGNLVMFSVLACLGFAMWTLYLTVIFGDPLYWVRYYAGSQSTTPGTVVYAQNLGMIAAIRRYFEAMVWMNGIIPMVFAGLGAMLCIYFSLKKKIFYTLPLFIPMSIYAFMVLTLMRNTPILQPELNLANILNPSTNNFNEFNIRYGLIMLPLVAVLCSYLYVAKNIFIRLILVAILGIQIFSYFDTKFTIIYQIPYKLQSTGNYFVGNDGATLWLKDHYDGGLILISALKHDPTMFRLGINYNRYIHEGTQKYWKDALVYPQRYATWVVMYNGGSSSETSSDPVTKELGGSPYLSQFFDEVHVQDGISIYKIKTKPEIIINN